MTLPTKGLEQELCDGSIHSFDDEMDEEFPGSTPCKEKGEEGNEGS